MIHLEKRTYSSTLMLLHFFNDSTNIIGNSPFLDMTALTKATVF